MAEYTVRAIRAGCYLNQRAPGAVFKVPAEQFIKPWSWVEVIEAPPKPDPEPAIEATTERDPESDVI